MLRHILSRKTIEMDQIANICDENHEFFSTNNKEKSVKKQAKNSLIWWNIIGGRLISLDTDFACFVKNL